MGNIVNRVFDSSGPEGKVRGTPQQIIDKYNQLARDAQLGNDRVAAENFQQHAEHYLRLLGEAQREQDARREQQEQQAQQAQQNRERSRADQQARDKDTETKEAMPAESSGADVIDIAGGDAGEDNGLVETPEEKPAPRRRTSSRSRKPAAPSPDQGAAPAGNDSADKPDDTPQTPAAE